MTPRDKVVACLVDLVGEDIAGPMADRHIRKYLIEKGKKELTEEDLSGSDFGTWFIERLQHLSMIKPQYFQAIQVKLKGA